MEEKQEIVNSPMLIAKHAKFEESLGIPLEEWLQGDRWILKFKTAYGIKEYCRHGEAASVDLAAVETERAHLRIVLAKYAPQDCFNFDETSFFAFVSFDFMHETFRKTILIFISSVPPNHGLATMQMSGKKKDQFQITLGVTCNADGSEKLPLIFIGKSKSPCCFGHKSPTACGFYYHNNSKVWIMKEIFEE